MLENDKAMTEESTASCTPKENVGLCMDGAILVELVRMLVKQRLKMNKRFEGCCTVGNDASLNSDKLGSRPIYNNGTSSNQHEQNYFVETEESLQIQSNETELVTGARASSKWRQTTDIVEQNDPDYFPRQIHQSYGNPPSSLDHDEEVRRSRTHYPHEERSCREEHEELCLPIYVSKSDYTQSRHPEDTDQVFDLQVSQNDLNHTLYCGPRNYKNKYLAEDKDVQKQNLRNWNGDLCPSDNLTEVQNVVMSRDEFSDFKDPPNRIIYNTKPMGSTSSSSPIFVCSTALSKKDALQFGEQSYTGLAKDFNVNAICNKTPSWGGEQVEQLTQDERNLVQLTLPPSETTCSDMKSPHARRTDGIWSNIHLEFQKRRMCLQQCLRSVLGRRANFPTPVVFGVIVTCAAFLTFTGNLLSFVGLMLDVTVQAALLFLVVVTTVAVFEGGNETTSTSCCLLESCHSFVQLVRGWIKDGDSPAKTEGVVRDADDEAESENGGVGLSCLPGEGGQEPDPETFDEPNGVQLLLETPIITNKKACSDATTMTEVAKSTSKYTNNTPDLSVAETMTETIGLQCKAAQTDPINNEEDAVVNYIPLADDEVERGGCGEAANAHPKEVETRSTGSQVNIDVKAIYDKAQHVQQRHHRYMRRFQRKFLAIRRGFQKEANVMKSSHQRRGDFLTKLQLTLPVLQREKNRLIAEKFTVERQYMDQKKKNQDLVGRIAKLNQQFQIVGQTQQPVLPLQWHPQLLTLANSSQPFKGPQGDMQQQQKQINKGGMVTKSQPTTQLTLSQANIAPTVPNKWLTHLQQFKQRHQVQSTQQTVQSTQQTNLHQQSRLPIFKLFHNSAPVANNNSDEVKRQQQQTQQHHHQDLHSPNPVSCSNSSSQMHYKPPSSMLSFQQGDHLQASQTDPLVVGMAGQSNNDN